MFRVTLRFCTIGTLLSMGLLSLILFSTPFLLAGGIAVAGLFVATWGDTRSSARRLTLMLAGWQLIVAMIFLHAPQATSLLHLTLEQIRAASIPVSFLAALQALLWRRSLQANPDDSELQALQNLALQLVSVGCLGVTLTGLPAELNLVQILMVCGTFLALAADRLVTALGMQASRRLYRDNAGESHVWAAEAIFAAGIGYLILFGVLPIGSGATPFALLIAAVAFQAIAVVAERSSRTAVLVRPLRTTAFALPAFVVGWGMLRHSLGMPTPWLGANSLSLLMAAGFYFWRGLEQRRSGLVVSSAAILNVALALLWRELRWSDPQFFLIPVGLSLLALVEFLREEIPLKWRDPLRYVGALVVLVSPTFHILDGAWWHYVSWLALSLLVTLAGIGLRVRAVMYTGTAFLIAALVAMVIRGSVDQPSVLWIVGIALGVGTISLGAYCEMRREQMLQRLRLIAAQLERWQ